MTRFSVKLKNILGLSYYRYELTSNKYNATIDATNDITITVKVTDIFGNNVSGKAVTLYHDGTSVSTQNTNSNGVATWTITPTTWGIHDFNISNQHCQVNVQGWKEVTVTGATSYATLYVNDAERLAFFKYYRSGYNFTNTSDVELHTNVIPSDYRPIVTIVGACFNPNVGLTVSAYGTISAFSISTGSKTINASAMWKY